MGEGWYAEGYFSRQKSKLRRWWPHPVDFDVAIERYLIGIQQETGTNPRVRWFGTFWLGATRFVPGLDDYGSETRFTGGVGLGVKTFFTDEHRPAPRGPRLLHPRQGRGRPPCVNGTCLFAFSGSGLWQGDVGGGLIIAF